MAQMPVSQETLQTLPSFVARQLQAYLARPQAVWELREQTVTPLDFEQPLFRTEGYYSYWTKGSHFWLEQNPSRVAVDPVYQESVVPDHWQDIDMWVIAWDTSKNDEVDELVVTALRIETDEGA